MAADAPVARWDARKVIEATLAGAGVAACFIFLYRFRLVFLAAFVGVVLAAAVRPIMAALVAFALLSTVATTIVVIAAPLVVDQITTIAERLPGWYDELRRWLVHSPSRLVRHASVRLPHRLDLVGSATPLTPD
jgi:predicted PurR-regulated permease PerM